MKPSAFDSKAAAWDSADRATRAKVWLAEILREVAPKPDACVIDFGAGTGLLSTGLAAHVGEVIAMDSSQGMLAELQKKCEAGQIGNISYQYLDIEKEAMPLAVCDVLVTCLTLHHLQSPAHFAAAALSALKPGGSLVVIDLEEDGGEFHDNHNGVHHHGFAPASLMSLFAQAGFSEARCVSLPSIRKESRSGGEKDFPLFMLLAKKPL